MAKEVNKGGRPRKELSEQVIVKMAAAGCTMIDIAECCECSVDTLENNYMEVIKIGRAQCRFSLRKSQIDLALSGNATMLIWLGKIMLGQREIQPEEFDQIKELLVRIDSSRIPKKGENAEGS